MRLDTTKTKEKGLFVSSDPTPCFIFPIHIKMLDCEFSSEALLDTRASICFIDKDVARKDGLELIGKAYLAPVEVIDRQPLIFRKYDGRNTTFGSNVKGPSVSCCVQYHLMPQKSSGTWSSLV